MIFSAKCEYGIRAMLDLAMNPEEGPVGVRTIAERRDISEGFLEQIMGALRKGGLVESIRGSRGGYVLARSPEEISLADVVVAIDGPVSTGPCVPGSESKRCQQMNICVIQDVWVDVTDCIMTVLSTMTLASLKERQLRKRVEAPGTPLSEGKGVGWLLPG